MTRLENSAAAALQTLALGPPRHRADAETKSENGAGIASLAANDLVNGLAEGKTFLQYQIGRRLGGGGMGQVFEARHIVLNKTFAIKFIRSDALGDAEARARFLREVNAIGQLQHPHLIAATDAGTDAGLHYCVTERLEGFDLQQLVERRGPLPANAAGEIIRQAADGLAHAHALGIIHRDIKPANLFLEHTGRVKVLDFGIVGFAQSSSPMTAANQILGTADYIAPEQTAAGRVAIPQSDIYGLGATLIFLISGQPPYPDATHPGLIEKLRAAALEQPRWLRDHATRLPASLIQLLERMLAKDPRQRFPSCAALVNDLSGLSDPAALDRWLTQEVPADPCNSWTIRSKSTSYRWRKLLVAGATVLVMMAAGGLWNLGPTLFRNAKSAGAGSVIDDSLNTGSLTSDPVQGVPAVAPDQTTDALPEVETGTSLAETSSPPDPQTVSDAQSRPRTLDTNQTPSVNASARGKTVGGGWQGQDQRASAARD